MKARHELPGGSQDLLISSNESVRVDWVPDTCPLCHRSAEIKVHAAWRHRSAARSFGLSKAMEVVYRCPSMDCQRLFVAVYEEVSGPTKCNLIKTVAPQNPRPIDLPKEAVAVSPEFEAIYQQAIEAESRSLDKIAGMGFRKALEFLVKDYLNGYSVRRPAAHQRQGGTARDHRSTDTASDALLPISGRAVPHETIGLSCPPSLWLAPPPDRP
jgi:hypothetical protein